jgi:geranylgeranyl pyrophosphate synthase
MNLSKITENISIHLNELTPNHSFSEVYKYGVLPPGKVFRPQLVSSIYKDFSKQTNFDFLNDSSYKTNYLASAVEIHHAYTLLHDDLPCMDDDNERRGKASTHIKFNEWKALLAADGLLCGSFRLLSNYQGKNLSLILKFFSWALGPKGLIQGQVLDLNEEMTLSFENLLKTHELKTARLIQTSMLLGLWSAKDESGNENIYKDSKAIFRLGHSIGIVFQILDDLTELVDDELSAHEQSVNPWLSSFSTSCFDTIINELERINTTLETYELVATKDVLANYFSKIEKLVISGKENIKKHSRMDILPVISLLQRINA